MQFYSDLTREQDPRFSPDSETLDVRLPDGSERDRQSNHPEDLGDIEPGFYWHTFLANGEPGDPIGPFDSEELAIADCRDGVAC